MFSSSRAVEVLQDVDLLYSYHGILTIEKQDLQKSRAEPSRTLRKPYTRITNCRNTPDEEEFS